jgi:hypothetical protein
VPGAGRQTTGAGQPAHYDAPLVPQTVEPWPGGGITAYVTSLGTSGADDPLASYFRGVMG